MTFLTHRQRHLCEKMWTEGIIILGTDGCNVSSIGWSSIYRQVFIYREGALLPRIFLETLCSLAPSAKHIEGKTWHWFWWGYTMRGSGRRETTWFAVWYPRGRASVRERRDAWNQRPPPRHPPTRSDSLCSLSQSYLEKKWCLQYWSLLNWQNLRLRCGSGYFTTFWDI